jgi:hypothetical protein
VFAHAAGDSFASNPPRGTAWYGVVLVLLVVVLVAVQVLSDVPLVSGAQMLLVLLTARPITRWCRALARSCTRRWRHGTA